MEEHMPKADKNRARTRSKFPRILPMLLVAVGVIIFITCFAFSFATYYDYQYNSGNETVEEVEAKLDELYDEYQKVKDSADGLDLNNQMDERVQEYNSKLFSISNEINELNIKRKMKTEGVSRDDSEYQFKKHYQAAFCGGVILVITILAAVVIKMRSSL
jgi:hypothetical protein